MKIVLLTEQSVKLENASEGALPLAETNDETNALKGKLMYGGVRKGFGGTNLRVPGVPRSAGVMGLARKRRKA